MTTGIGNEWDPGDPPEIHRERKREANRRAAIATQGAQAGEFDARALAEQLSLELCQMCSNHHRYGYEFVDYAQTESEQGISWKISAAMGQGKDWVHVLTAKEESRERTEKCKAWMLWAVAYAAGQAAQPLQREVGQKEYPHLLICSGDRRYPAGVKGHGCCCLNVATDYMKGIPLQPQVEELRELSEAATAENRIPGVYTGKANQAFKSACVEFVRKLLQPGTSASGKEGEK